MESDQVQAGKLQSHFCMVLANLDKARIETTQRPRD